MLNSIIDHKEKVESLLNFQHFAEKLKCVVRHGWTSSGRQESVAEHCWRLALMIIQCSGSLDQRLDLEKALKMAIIHDIAEVITDDIPYFLAREGSEEKKTKQKKEKSAIESIKKNLDNDFGDELEEVWREYEQNDTYEAKVVKAIDKIEAQIQQNEAGLSTWLECERKDATEGYLLQFCNFDSFLLALSKEVISESIKTSLRRK